MAQTKTVLIRLSCVSVCPELYFSSEQDKQTYGLTRPVPDCPRLSRSGQIPLAVHSVIQAHTHAHASKPLAARRSLPPPWKESALGTVNASECRRIQPRKKSTAARSVGPRESFCRFTRGNVRRGLYVVTKSTTASADFACKCCAYMLLH